MAATPVIEAIQVVECQDGLVQNGDEHERIIKTIPRFRNGPSLEELFRSHDTKDLPILVFSITGKTRGGKSLLLNLMIKYLESQDKGETHWLRGSAPNCFAWKGGVDSVTRGLWMWPKVYVRKNAEGEKLGILLLDNEGMFDGEATDGEVIAMSGISTAISFVQMFNLSNKITTDTLENIVRNIVKGIEDIDPGEDSLDMDLEMQMERQKNYSLMFVVRDWMGEDSHAYGVRGGSEYIERDRLRGSRDNRALWSEVHNAFSDVNCLLLPHPGVIATKAQFTNSGDLQLLEPEFLNEVKEFVESLFAPENLTLPQNILTGEQIYSLLKRIDKKVADDNLSFMNMFTDHANYIKVEKFKEEFASMMSRDRVDIQDAKSAIIDILEEAARRLKGKSAPEHFGALKTTLEATLNRKVIDAVLIKYEELFQCCSTIVNHHKSMWRNVQVKLTAYLCGNKTTVAEAKRKVAEKSANIYYSALMKETLKNFKSTCMRKGSLEELAGLDEQTITVNFKECIDFEYFGGSKDLVHSIYFHYHQRVKDEITGMLLNKISSLTKISMEMLTEARKQQYEHFENLTLLSTGEADCIKIQNKDNLLRKKIGYALFGCPPISSGLWMNTLEKVSRSSFPTGYSRHQNENIENIAAKILSQNAIECSCVFVTFQQDNKVVSSPIFRIRTLYQNNQFIDSNCRVYKGLQDFIESNTLPDVVYCYPLNGRYDKNKGFFVAFAKSPALKPINKVLKVSDTAGNVVTGVAGVAGAAVLAAPLVGVALPVVGACAIVGGGIAGVYGLTRGVVKIYNKVTHKQSVGGGDIFNLATNALAVGSMGTVAVAERLVATALKSGQALIGLNAFAALLTSDDTPDLVLLNEIDNNALKILFYFNAPSSTDAIKVIQNALGMDEDVMAKEVLEKLVEINRRLLRAERGGKWRNMFPKM